MLFPSAHYHFEDFIEATARINSREHLIEVFVAAMRGLGYDRVNFSVKHDDALPASERKFGIISTYPEDWQRFYEERTFIKIDPVLRCAAGSFRPFRWKELERTLRLTPQQVRFLRLGEEAGLHNGVGIPFNGPRSQIAGIALATSDKAADRMTNTDLISAYCNQFYVVFKRIVAPRIPTLPSMAYLSARENEILRWVAIGKSDDQIADILTISTNTVNYHLRRIFLKFDVNSRIMAVVAAIASGQIEL